MSKQMSSEMSNGREQGHQFLFFYNRPWKNRTTMEDMFCFEFLLWKHCIVHQNYKLKTTIFFYFLMEIIIAALVIFYILILCTLVPQNRFCGSTVRALKFGVILRNVNLWTTHMKRKPLTRSNSQIRTCTVIHNVLFFFFKGYSLTQQSTELTTMIFCV